MFKIILARKHAEENPEFHLAGDWRYQKGGMSELREGDLIFTQSLQYYAVIDKQFYGDGERVYLDYVGVGAADALDKPIYSFLPLQEGYKLISKL